MAVLDPESARYPNRRPGGDAHAVKARLTLCVFLWVNGLEPQNIVALGRPLALHGLLRDDAAKTNWESIVERLINNKSFRQTGHANGHARNVPPAQL